MKIFLAVFLWIGIFSCGKSVQKHEPSPVPHTFQLTEDLPGSVWMKSTGKCVYALKFEETPSSVFYYYYVCREEPNLRNTMGSYGSYKLGESTIAAERFHFTCPSLENEKVVEMTTDGNTLIVKSTSTTIALTRKANPLKSKKDDQVVWGCFDAGGSFTPHDWF
jgi:hypothetical protein